jgi:iron complex outermembrane receptor protein
MAGPRRAVHLAVVCLFQVGGVAHAGDEPELADLSIDELMNVSVETATREPRRAGEAPAIVSVITRDELRAFGFESVAEALVLVPGFYCIDDHLTADCGVRGVSGGERGYSKVLRVMIDGQPVAFRADTTSFLGPELVPIDLVERIEVVRGPVSALYGANAFYGAVNVITRQQTDGHTVGLRVRLGDELGAGLSAVYLGGGDSWSLSAGFAGLREDYDGRAIPASSPDFDVLADLGNLEARDTRRLPRVGFARLAWRRGPLGVELAGRYSELDARAEFLDFGTLSHDNRVVLRSLDARLLARYQPVSRLVLTAALGAADGRPGADEALSSGAADSYPRREFASTAFDAQLEGRVRLLGDDDWLTLGIDFSHDDEDLIEVYSVDRPPAWRP